MEGGRGDEGDEGDEEDKEDRRQELERSSILSSLSSVSYLLLLLSVLKRLPNDRFTLPPSVPEESERNHSNANDGRGFWDSLWLSQRIERFG